MKSLNKIISKIEKIEKLLNEVKEELKQITAEEVSEKKETKKEERNWDYKSLQSEFDNLYQRYINSNNTTIINGFVNEKDVIYLKDFCKANNISLDSKKVSKDKIAEEILKWFSQRKAISKRL
ncbi:MAG: hypothetical protein WA440_06500 [Ignavibacteriaceae bacterium]|mgnify:CR=1 FL=1|nr:hypothetical protein [Ignavibacteriaceae bacterium]